MGKIDLNYNEITDVEVEGIDRKDYPDFCDAFIASATYMGREMTDVELDVLNENQSFVYARVLERLY